MTIKEVGLRLICKPEFPAAAKSLPANLFVISKLQFLIGRDHRLNSISTIHAQTFRLMKKNAGTNEQHDDPGSPHREEKLAALAVHQHHAADRRKKIDDSENNVAPMRLHIRKTALQQDVCVVSNDGIDSRGLVAGEYHAGRQTESRTCAAKAIPFPFSPEKL